MLIDIVKVGDVLTTQGTGYQSKTIHRYTVARITKTQIICRHASNAVADFKIDRYGCMLPKDKYINHYVTHVNGKPIE